MRSLILGLVALGLSACSCNQDTPVENPEEAALDPGRVVLHRLNRAEYNNTVQDLLGTQLTPADDFPWDDTSHGFDLAVTAAVGLHEVDRCDRAHRQSQGRWSVNRGSSWRLPEYHPGPASSFSPWSTTAHTSRSLLRAS